MNTPPAGERGRNSGSRGSRRDGLHLGVLLAAFSIPISIAAAEPLLYIVGAAWLMRAIRERDFRGAASGLFGSIGLVLLFGVFAAAAGPRTGESLWTCHRFLFFLLIPVMRSLVLRGVPALRLTREVMVAYAAGAAVLGLYDLVRVPVQVSGGMDLYDTGNMRDPQLYLVAVLFLCALAGTARSTRGRVLWGLALASCAGGLVVHFKRGAWIAFGGAAGLWALLVRKWVMILLLLAAGGGLLMLPATRARLQMLQEETSVHLGGRYSLWRDAAPGMIRDHPLGTGFKATAHEDLLAYTPHIQPGLDHLHNNLLQVAVDFGWAGLLVWMVWVLLVLATFARAWWEHSAGRDPAGRLAAGGLAAFAGLQLNGLVEYNFGDSEVMMAMALLTAMAAAIRVRTGAGDGLSAGKGE